MREILYWFCPDYLPDLIFCSVKPVQIVIMRSHLMMYEIHKSQCTQLAHNMGNIFKLVISCHELTKNTIICQKVTRKPGACYLPGKVLLISETCHRVCT